jgi:hypothetical protein
VPEDDSILTLRVSGQAVIGDEELSHLSESLREDLIEAGAGSVERPGGGEVPAGAKGEPLTLATLLVALAPPVLTGLIAAL